jgi:hypothetical protein
VTVECDRCDHGLGRWVGSDAIGRGWSVRSGRSGGVMGMPCGREVTGS